MHELVTIGNLLGNDKNEADFALPMEILMWGSDKFDEFRFTELGNWLIENHRPFKDEFAGSHTRRSYRLHSKRSYIKSRMEDLVRLGLIRKHGTAKAEKNRSDRSSAICCLSSGDTLGLSKSLGNISFL